MKLLNHIALKVLLVFLVAVLQYSNTSEHKYAWDDAIVLTENTRVQKGLSNIPELFENIKSEETQNRYGYRPISLLSFATDVELFGFKPEPAHKTSILYYGILCVIVLFFLQTLFPHSGWRNVILTLLFVVHPLHTEVVANIKSRDEVLAMIFGLGGLILYSKGLLNHKRWLFVLSGLLMVLSFHSKESGIVFVGVALLLPWYAKKDLTWKSYFHDCKPVFGFFAVLIAIRLFAYSDFFFQSNDWELYKKGLFLHDGFVGNPLSDSGFLGKLAMAFFLLVYFVYRFFNPYPLVHDYSFNQFEVLTWADPEVYGAILILALVVFFGAKAFLRKTPYGFGIAFFFITSSVYLHIIQTAPDLFAERYLFAPSLGIILGLSVLYQIKVKPIVFNALFVMLLFPMYAYSWERNKVWKDNKTLLESDLPLLTNCVRANYNYALYLHREYYDLPPNLQPAAREEILKHYERTMELTDRLFNAYLDLGAAYMEFGKPDKAFMVFTKACQNYPDLSAPFVQMGKYYMSFNEYGKAIPYFEKALINGKQNSDYHYLLAICLFNSEQKEEAISILLEGEHLGVSSSAYHSLIARLYSRLDRKQDAVEALRRGLKLYPTDQGLQNELKSLSTEG